MMQVFALLLAFGSAVGASLDDDARYVEAVRAYEELELDAALASFRALSVDPKVGEKDRARLLVWIGLTRAQRSELDEAGKAFDAALVLDRSARLPVRTSPKVAALFEEARARMPDERVIVDEPARPRPRPTPKAAPPDTLEPESAGVPLPAIVAGTAGAVALVGAGVAGVLTTVHYSGAMDRSLPQLDAKALVDLANAELTTALVLGGAAVVLGGAALIFLDASDDEETKP